MAFKGVLDKKIDETLKVNSKFAKSFEVRKHREEVQKAKKRAEELEIYSGSEKSSESEDSSGELLTEKANSKFMKVLSMIKKGDPKLKDPNFQAFSDSDFEKSSESSVHSSKPVRYKELLSKQLANPEAELVKDTPAQQQKDLKSQFLSAVDDWSQKNTEELLVSRKVPKKPTQTDDLDALVNENIGGKTDVKALKEYWTHANDADDLFLKKFVLKKLWEDPEEQLMTYNEIVDEEDAKKTDEVEKFETAFNFRFEEEGFEKLKSKK